MAVALSSTSVVRVEPRMAVASVCCELKRSAECPALAKSKSIRSSGALVVKHQWRQRSESIRLKSLTTSYRCSSGVPIVRCHFVQFQASRSLNLPFKEGSSSSQEYLKELERVVRVTFPDSTRITYLGNSVWRARLKPITFFNVSATPYTDMRVFNEDSSLGIFSNTLDLDFSGVPEQYKSLNINFLLEGSLRAFPVRYQRGQSKFEGRVVLKLGAELPLPFSLFPDALLTGAGNGILDTIIGAMESALLKGILDDYYSWCKTRQKAGVVQALP